MAPIAVSGGLSVYRIAALQDNYIWILRDQAGTMTAAIDPGDANPVEKFLDAQGWKLNLIICTHHHRDHIDGIEQLVDHYHCPVWASQYDQNRVPRCSRGLADDETISTGPAKAHVVATPGHTHGHIVLHFGAQKFLFCGDTLFAMGCGRLFEGTALELFQSLKKLSDLPPDTKIFCTHEYTERNAQFAVRMEPHNPRLLERVLQVAEARSGGLPTVPFLLGEELATNPFLRCHSEEIRRNLGLESADDVVVFTRLRELRNLS